MVYAKQIINNRITRQVVDAHHPSGESAGAEGLWIGAGCLC